MAAAKMHWTSEVGLFGSVCMMFGLVVAVINCLWNVGTRGCTRSVLARRRRARLSLYADDGLSDETRERRPLCGGAGATDTSAPSVEMPTVLVLPDGRRLAYRWVRAHRAVCAPRA